MRPHVRRATRALPLAAISCLLLAPAALAADYRSGDAVTLPAGETVEEDLYVGGGTATIDGTVEGDLTITGGTVTVGGEVTGSVNVAGGTFTLNGTVGGAVRSAAGTVTIAGAVGRDLVSLGGTVTVGPAGSVGGDVAGATGTLRIDGTVGGDVEVAAGELFVDGTVEGSIDAEVGTLRIGSTAAVGGDVRYGSDREAEIADGATIGGTVERRAPTTEELEAAIPDNPLVRFLGLLLGLLVTGWLLLLARPRAMVLAGAALRARPLLGLGVGLAGWVGQFLLVIALGVLAALLSLVAASLGGAFVVPLVVVLLLVVVLALIAQVYVAMAIGDAIGAPLSLSAWLSYAVGALVWAGLLTLAGLIAGALALVVYLAGWILGIGALILYARERRWPERIPTVHREPTAA